MTPPPSRLQSTLIELERALSAAGIRHAIAGGIAMAAHGRVRATEDIDVLADAAQGEAIRAVMRSLGYVEEAPGPVSTRYIRQPMPEVPGLADWVDVLFVSRLNGRRLLDRAAARPVDWAGTSLIIVDPAGLILMKTLALTDNPNRPSDAQDVQFLLTTHADQLDMESLRREAAELGADVASTLAALIEASVREPNVITARSRL